MKFNTELLEYSDIQLIDGDRGKNYPKESDFMVDGYCLFLSAKNVTSKGFEFSEKSFIDYEKDKLLRAGKLKRGDIVVTTRGTIGNIAFYGNDIPFDNIRINSGMMIFRADEEKWNRRFLYFLLRSNYIRQQIVSLTSGSAVPQLPARDLKKFILPRLPKDIQGSIEKIIGDFTDKIQLNRQINQTLESMAQAIFQSWFVDFDPVKAKIAAREQWQILTDDQRTEWLNELLDKQAFLKTCLSELTANGEQSASEILYINIAAMTAISSRDETSLADMSADEFSQLYKTASLFPERLVESELGEIPEGWEVKAMIDYLDSISKTYPLKTVENVVFLNTGDIQNGQFLHANLISPVGLPGQAKKSITKGDILYSEIRPKNKRYAYVFFDVDDYVVSTKLMVLRSNGQIDSKFLYFILTQESVVDYLQVLAESRSGTFPQITFDVLSKVEFLAPEDNVLTKVFVDNILNGFMAKMFQTNNEILELSRVRDSLLPKLLSGELSIL
jgi:type I restriction enzyme S subunit